MESRPLLRDQEPSVKNTTNQIKDLFLLRVESSFLLSGRKDSSGHLHMAHGPLCCCHYSSTSNTMFCSMLSDKMHNSWHVQIIYAECMQAFNQVHAYCKARSYAAQVIEAYIAPPLLIAVKKHDLIPS